MFNQNVFGEETPSLIPTSASDEILHHALLASVQFSKIGWPWRLTACPHCSTQYMVSEERVGAGRLGEALTPQGSIRAAP